MENTNRPYGIIIGGVGGQGTITLAKMILTAAWKSGYNVMQSEVHGMSQRGGSVNAHILVDTKPVSSPVVMEGAGDLLIGLEPLETLRYLELLKRDATIITSTIPIKNMQNYPDSETIINELNNIAVLIDTDKYNKELNNKRAGNIILLGIASLSLPISTEVWNEVFREKFETKDYPVLEKSINAFYFGRELFANGFNRN